MESTIKQGWTEIIGLNQTTNKIKRYLGEIEILDVAFWRFWDFYEAT